MKVEDFVKLTKGKDNYDFGQRIKLKYMPYVEKLAFVESIVKNSSYVEVDSKKVYQRNTSNMLFLFTMQTIQKYTDLEFADTEVVQTYDLLMSSGLIRPLLQQVPEQERMILREMLDARRDDEEANTRSLVSFLETKADAIQFAIDNLVDVLAQPDMQAKISKYKK